MKHKDAVRIQQSLLSGIERKMLIYLALKIPRGVSSDHLTLLGFGAAILTGVAYGLAGYDNNYLWLASFWLVVNWFGDSLDGSVARVRNKQRPRYGFYVDHIADTFGALFVVGGLALSTLIHPWIAAAILTCYYILSIDIYLATYACNSFRLSYWIFGPTELRVLMIIGNCFLYFQPTVHLAGQSFRLLDVGGVCAIVALLMICIVSVSGNIRKLYRAEPLAEA